MAMEKPILIQDVNYGMPVTYWRGYKLREFNTDTKVAVIYMSGYFNKDSRDASPEPLKGYDWEFLVTNEVHTIQTPREATLAEKKAQLPPTATINATDDQINAMSLTEYDTSTITTPYFDVFAAKISSSIAAGAPYENAVKEAIYDFVKTHPLPQQYFSGATDLK